MEYKSVIAKIGDVDVKGQRVAGWFSVFGNVDSDNDILMPGAFTKTIAERGPKGANQIPHLLQHKWDQPLGKPIILEERPFGGYFETNIVDVTYGIDTIKLYAAGVYNEHSFGFETINSANSTREGKDVREITEVKLWEYSTVTFGANDLTRFEGFKSLNKSDKIEQIMERLELLSRAITDYRLSEQGKEFIHIGFMQLADLLKSLKEDREPEQSTPIIVEPTIPELLMQFEKSLKTKMT